MALIVIRWALDRWAVAKNSEKGRIRRKRFIDQIKSG
jgi:hypothetical protein